MKLSELKKGEYFTLRPYEKPEPRCVYIKGVFDRKKNRYDCERYSEIGSSHLFRSNTTVYTDFVC